MQLIIIVHQLLMLILIGGTGWGKIVLPILVDSIIRKVHMTL